MSNSRPSSPRRSAECRRNGPEPNDHKPQGDQADRDGRQPRQELSEQQRVAIDRVRQNARHVRRLYSPLMVEANPDRHQGRHQDGPHHDERQQTTGRRRKQPQEQERVLDLVTSLRICSAAKKTDRTAIRTTRFNTSMRAGQVSLEQFARRTPRSSPARATLHAAWLASVAPASWYWKYRIVDVVEARFLHRQPSQRAAGIDHGSSDRCGRTSPGPAAVAGPWRLDRASTGHRRQLLPFRLRPLPRHNRQEPDAPVPTLSPSGRSAQIEQRNAVARSARAQADATKAGPRHHSLERRIISAVRRSHADRDPTSLVEDLATSFIRSRPVRAVCHMPRGVGADPVISGIRKSDTLERGGDVGTPARRCR